MDLQTTKAFTLATYVLVLLLEAFAAALFSLRYGRNKPTGENRRNFLLGTAAAFFALVFVGQAVWMYYNLVLTQWYQPSLFDQAANAFSVGQALVMGGFAFLLYLSERVAFGGRTRSALTIFFVAVIVVSLFPFPREVGEALMFYTTVPAMGAPLLLWIYVGVKGVGSVRKQAILLTMGLLSLAVGMLTAVTTVNLSIATGLPLGEALPSTVVLTPDQYVKMLLVYGVGYVFRIVGLILLIWGFTLAPPLVERL
ncbi:MAG: hypothetical protein Kow0069_13020 [Promethearchaeota archaeon]